jgi:hypothetical protein
MKTVIVGMISRDNVIEDAKNFMASWPGSVWATWDDWYTETYVFAMSQDPKSIPDDAHVVVACGELGAGAKTWREYLGMIEGDEVLLNVMRKYPSIKNYLESEQVFDVDEI